MMTTVCDNAPICHQCQPNHKGSDIDIYIVGTASVALSTRHLVAYRPSYHAGITSSAVSGLEREWIEMGQFLTTTTLYCILYGIYCSWIQ